SQSPVPMNILDTQDRVHGQKFSAREHDLEYREYSWEQAIENIQSIPITEQKQTVVWCDLKTMNKLRSSEQALRLNSIKQIFPNQHFLTYRSMIKLVDDLRSLQRNLRQEGAATKCDITLIANAADEILLDKTAIILEGMLNIECIRVDASEEKDVEAICSAALKKSRMVVVVAGAAGEWAVNFTRQIWKNNGGASSQTTLLVLFDRQYFTQAEELKIPGVRCLLADDSMAGLEVKVEFDRMMSSVHG
ncbi:MAG: hypothetical protein ACKOSR_09355, partial [Flavobacteriales bacterium]